MTPAEKIRFAILTEAIKDGVISVDEPITSENVVELYESNNEEYELQDYESAFREGTVETGLKCEWSRHYESKSVAARMPDGSWVGWTYWYGGGKHGEPESIDWIDSAYDVACTEEEKMVVVRTFTKVPA